MYQRQCQLKTSGFRTKGDVGCLNLNNWRNNKCDSTLVSDGILTQLFPMSNSTVQLECSYKLGLSTISGFRNYNSAARSRTEEEEDIYIYGFIPLAGTPKPSR